jgi:thiamine-monophosphate kinase
MKEKTLLHFIQKISQNTGASHLDDDAAMIRDLVISTDQFVEGTHFQWSQANEIDIGYKGVVQALSDLAAMATKPAGLLVSAAFPKTISPQTIESLFVGIEQACLDYSVPLWGGDLTASPTTTFFDFVVFGFNKKPLTKTGAQPGDLLAVSGPLGSAKGGWLSLENHWPYEQLKKSFLRPQAKIKTALALAEKSALSSLTDISDSLSKSVYSLAKHSGCGFEVNLKKIPQDLELQKLCSEQNLSLAPFLLNGGEDYQLLMTLPPHSSEKLISDFGLTLIGRATSAKEIYCIEDEKKSIMTEVGWDPFDL